MINKYSFILAALILILVTGSEVWRMQRGVRWRRMVIWGALVGLGVGGWWVALRPTPSLEVQTTADADRLIGHGQPVLLEIYSEY